MINIGKYIEIAINWLTDNLSGFFDAISMVIGGFIETFQIALFGIPFYITIALVELILFPLMLLEPALLLKL